MNAEAWKERLGEDAWNFINGGDEPGEPHEYGQQIVAALLNRLTEVGWQPPEVQAEVSNGATAVKFGTIRALTARGLLQHWQARGHAWMVFRLEPLMKAVAGPLLPQLQQIWTAYEQQCTEEGLTTPDLVPAEWFGFVGGDKGALNDQIGRALRELAPGREPPKLPTGKVEGPG